MRARIVIACVGALAAVVAWLAVAPEKAQASTVLETSVSEMLARCEFIFEGRVVEVWPEDSERGIHTWVRFEVLDVLKGPSQGPTVSLSFLGGQVEGRRRKVTGMRLPELGERGVYFVESLQRFQVNPLFGWDQGRLRIVPDAGGVLRVVSAAGRPIVGLRSEMATRSAARSTGTARELQVDPGAPLERALTSASLKSALATALQASR